MSGKHHVGLYVHVPVCSGKCPYCAFYSVPVHKVDTPRLTASLLNELASYRHIRHIATAYVGGGSPTALPLDQLLSLVSSIRRGWPPLQEFTVECNPGQVTPHLLDSLRAQGVDRLSFGAQALHPEDLKTLGRRHTVRDVQRAVQWAQAVGFTNIGLDLIFAIPGSTMAAWSHSLQAAIHLGVQHISAYSLTFEPGTPLDQARAAGTVTPVEESLDRDMYETAIAQLGAAGFEQYEISNFARPGFTCRHNLGYWENRPFIGVGPAAASYWQGRRTMNTRDIQDYAEAIEQGHSPVSECEPVDAAMRTCETAVLNLRLRRGIDLRRFKRDTGHHATEIFAREIASHQQQNHLTVTDRAIMLTDQALPIADSVLCDFACLEV